MPYSSARIRYRRNILPACALKGERVKDITTGILKYTRACVAYRGGFVDRNIGPYINPVTGGIDNATSPGQWLYGNYNQPPTPADKGFSGVDET